MGAKYTNNLIEFKAVTDHDCGNYHIGEIDVFTTYELDKFLRDQGVDGYKDLMFQLAATASKVAEAWQHTQQYAAEYSQAKTT